MPGFFFFFFKILISQYPSPSSMIMNMCYFSRLPSCFHAKVVWCCMTHIGVNVPRRSIHIYVGHLL